MKSQNIATIVAVSFLAIAIGACTGKWETEPQLSSAVRVDTTFGHGSGVRISETEIITAAHVVGDETHVTVISMGGDEFTAGVAHKDTEHDVAILLMPKTDTIRIAPLLCTRPAWGTRITHQGYPLGFKHTWMEGYVMVDSLPKEVGRWPDGIVAFLPSAPGSSGGPVYVGREVVGTVVAGPAVQPSMTIVIPGDRLCKELEEARAVR